MIKTLSSSSSKGDGREQSPGGLLGIESSGAALPAGEGPSPAWPDIWSRTGSQDMIFVRTLVVL
jgi:hypothetical protein